MDEGGSEDKLYHERQVRELCALHALNNILQQKQAFTKKDLDDICIRLSPEKFINPHRSLLGLGNYDVNVIMAALQEKGYETVWFDKRKDVDVLELDNVMGLILNTPSDYKLGGFFKLPIHRKHWIAIRCLRGQYMNLDSKLDSPVPIGNSASLLQFLREELSDGEKELLLVVEPSVYEKSSWRRDSNLCNAEDERTKAEVKANVTQQEQVIRESSSSENGQKNGSVVHNGDISGTKGESSKSASTTDPV